MERLQEIHSEHIAPRDFTAATIKHSFKGFLRLDMRNRQKAQLFG
jgi:hypothetical protein|tara:strand:+ start:20380 stop:20514 length:135 start_codon:yes stop_codon:yes gene_type:complete